MTILITIIMPNMPIRDMWELLLLLKDEVKKPEEPFETSSVIFECECKTCPISLV